MPNDDRKSAERPARVEKPEHGTRLSAVEIHDNVLAGATEEAERPWSSLLWSAVASGLAIGFSFLAGGYLASLATTESYRHALAAAGYPLGFIFVVLGRSELFTENTLEPVLPLLHERSARRLKELLRLWGLLLAGNLVGTLAFAWLLARTPMVEARLHESLRPVAELAIHGGAGVVFYEAIYAGWLMALMVWLLGATTGPGTQILLVWLCTWAIGAFEFRHSIAGAVEAFYLAIVGAASWGQALGGFLAPAVLGNALGGVVFVAVLNYAQVKNELAPKPRTKK